MSKMKEANTNTRVAEYNDSTQAHIRLYMSHKSGMSVAAIVKHDINITLADGYGDYKYEVY